MSIDDQIRRLLAIAQDPGASANEREVAMERASILMARHSITHLAEEASKGDVIETRTITIPGGITTPSLAQSQGIHQVAWAGGATTYYVDERRRRGCPGVVVHVVGFASDLDWLIPLITTLTAQTASAWSAWRKAAGGYKRMKPVNQRRARAGFVLGYATGVSRRIQLTRRTTINARQEAGDTSTALVVRDRERRLADYVATLDLRKGVDVDVHERAYTDGTSAGWESRLGADTPSLDDAGSHTTDPRQGRFASLRDAATPRP